MELTRAIYKRRSCRKYLAKKVSNDLIEKLLKSAMASPSAINKQPWEFYIIKNDTMMQKIREIAPAWDRNSPLMIVVAGNKKHFIEGREEFWLADCSAAVENILLEATNLNLGSLWCGVYPHRERMYALKKLINLPKDQIPYALIHIGYAAEKLEARTQYDPNKVHYIH